MTHLHEKKPANERRISVDQPSLRISISLSRDHMIQFFPPNLHFWSIGQKTQKKCAYDFETHIGNKQKLSLKQDFLRKTPFLSDPSPIVALSWKSLSPSSCWICWIHVIHHQTLFNLRIWLSLRKSKLVQLSKLSKSLVKIIKLKFGQDFVRVVTWIFQNC